MKMIEITCDACAHDLSDAGAMPTYCLVLTSNAVPNSGNILYSVAVSPDLDRPYHFCDLSCLDHWRRRENHRANLWRKWWDKWKEERGTKSEDGHIRSYPSPPREVTAAAEIEFEGAALTAFPRMKLSR